jgi:glycosyltransferase involved in cell wall biosynthesis
VIKALEHVDRVIVINDCSTDDTAKIAKRAGAEVITHPENRGYGGALKTAFEVAMNKQANAMIILDGDGQHNAGEIPKLLKPIIDGGAQVVIGGRMHQNNRGGIPGYRKLGIKLITKIANLGMETTVTDSQSGYRAFSSEAIEKIEFSDTGMGASTEVLLQSSNSGLSITEVPVSVRYDVGISSKHPVIHGLGVIGQLVRYAENRHPLLVFSLPGSLLFLAGFLLGMEVLYSYSTGSTPSLGRALISMVLIFVGTMSAFTGLLLHAMVGKDTPLQRGIALR